MSTTGETRFFSIASPARKRWQREENKRLSKLAEMLSSDMKARDTAMRPWVDEWSRNG